MNKSAIVAAYQNFRKQHRLTISELVITGMAVAVMNGIRKEADNLDLLVSEEMYDKTKRRLCRYEGAKVRFDQEGEALIIGDLVLWRGIPDIKYVVINGITCNSVTVTAEVSGLAAA